MTAQGMRESIDNRDKHAAILLAHTEEGGVRATPEGPRLQQPRLATLLILQTAGS